MPMYTYKCWNDHVVEEMRPMADRDYPGDCKECGTPLKRQIDRPGMVYAPTSSGTATHK